jgi:sodium-coupled neutral amino acid transporter 11
MFTTLPLELFVCREVSQKIESQFLIAIFLTLLFQVVEQYFFSHESYNPQRHLFFTTTILFASMFGERKIYLADNPYLNPFCRILSGGGNL